MKPLGQPGNPTGANQHSGEGEGNSCNYKDSAPGENTNASYIDARLARDADPETSPLEPDQRERVAVRLPPLP